MDCCPQSLVRPLISLSKMERTVSFRSGNFLPRGKGSGGFSNRSLALRSAREEMWSAAWEREDSCYQLRWARSNTITVF